MQNRIGLLSSQPDLIEDLRTGLSSCELHVSKSPDTVRQLDYSVFFIDIDMFDSSETIQFYLSKLRKKFQSTPILLIVKSGENSSVNHEWFFDDFIFFPFRKGELSMRMERLLHLKGNAADDGNTISIGRVRINLPEYSVYLDDAKLDFTYKEFELLRLLVQNKGVVFSRKELLGKIWGLEYIGGTRTVDVHIRRLRSKLGDEFNSLIETVRNVGYCCRVQ